MDDVIVTTPENLAQAFSEWERRFREQPEKFVKYQERLKLTTQNYGEQCAAYLCQLLDQQN